jgi:hypothetical protein
MAAMSSDDFDLDEALQGDDNYPAPGLGGGAGGSKPHISVEVARERRMALAGLMASGVERDAQDKVMSAKYSMTPSAVDRLRKEVHDHWQRVDQEELAHAKAAWLRRNLRHVQRASTDGAWSAVGKLEDNLAKVLGLVAPVQVQSEGVVHHVHSAAGADTIKAVVGAYTEEQLAAFAQRERLLQAKPEADDAEFVPLDVQALDEVEAELERAVPARPRRKRSQVATPR